MEFKRRVDDRWSVLLLLLGNVVTVIALSETVQSLDCTNDYDELMSCELTAQNCTEYSVTLRSNSGHGEVGCRFKQCEKGPCCCVSTKMILIPGEFHTATVWNGGKDTGSKTINVTEGIKPKVPTITSVKESNGNFVVMWKTNMKDSISNGLKANVTYHIKGDAKQVHEVVSPTTVNGLKFHEITGRHLKSSTTYMVSVKSLMEGGRSGESSEEWAFTTPVPTDTLLLAAIASLCVAAVVLSGVTYFCYVKVKTKWWDSVAKCPNPKLLHMHPSDQELLKPAPPFISPVCVEHFDPDASQTWSLKDSSCGSLQQSSGIRSGSSCLSYAKTEQAHIIAGVQEALEKAFANISPMSSLTVNPLTESNKDSGVRAADVSSGSSGFDNRTYSILIPDIPHQFAGDSGEFQAGMLCDSAYRPSEGETAIGADHQAPACPLLTLPPGLSPLLPTDMSYQQCNADSGRLSYVEDSSSSSVSSGTVATCDPASRVGAGCESFGDARLSGNAGEAVVCDENPCYGCAPAGLRGFPQVDGDHQAFQRLVEQPGVVFAEEQNGEEEELLSRCSEGLCAKTPQSLFSPGVPCFVDNAERASELLRAALPFTCAGPSMPVITESGYQSV